MAPPAAGGGDGQPQRQQQQSGFGLTEIIWMSVFWYFASKFFSPKKAPADPSLLMSNIFQKGESLDMWVYLSKHEKFNDFSDEQKRIWHETNIPYAVWSPQSTRTLSLKYYPSEALKNNGSLYAHIFFARSGYPVDPSDPEYQPFSSFGKTHPIVVYFPKPKTDKRKHLLDTNGESSETEVIEEVKDDGPPELISYWKPNITINLVDDFTRYPQNAVPPNIAPYLNVDPKTGDYYPTIILNEICLLRNKLIAINETVEELPLNLEVGPISMTKWQRFMLIDESVQIHQSYASMIEGEADELKVRVGKQWKELLDSIMDSECEYMDVWKQMDGW